MPKHPLAEVFGFPPDNHSKEAKRFRKHRLCPFGNGVPNCTKDKAKDPLGVCSILDGDTPVITCPIRFREGWIIAEDAAAFFFPEGTQWTTLTEVRLKDRHGKSAGNVDVVLVAYDERGRVIDFGALEVQAVYISGNIRNPFQKYMENPVANSKLDWQGRPNFPKPDYLSSSRKRLAPQLIFKGGILKAWRKKTAVALNKGFFETLPNLKEVHPSKADIAWLIYDLARDGATNRLELVQDRVVYTSFEESLLQITRSEAGEMEDFVEELQDKIDKKLDGPSNPPDLEVVDAPF